MENNNDKANLEENLRNFEPLKSKAAEEAKKILFGRALPAEDADILDNTYSRLFQPKTDTSMDIQNEKGEEQGFDATKWIEEIHFRSPESWIKTVRDYCQQNSIQPQDLINFYNEHHTQPPK